MVCPLCHKKIDGTKGRRPHRRQGILHDYGYHMNFEHLPGAPRANGLCWCGKKFEYTVDLGRHLRCAGVVQHIERYAERWLPRVLS